MFYRSNYYMTDGGVENRGLDIVENVFDQKEIDTDETPTNANFNMSKFSFIEIVLRMCYFIYSQILESKSYSMGNKLKTSKSSTAPHWYYEEGSDVIPCNSLTTRDLMCWSFQIARGMDYLASKHVCLFPSSFNRFKFINCVFISRSFMEIWRPGTFYWPMTE